MGSESRFTARKDSLNKGRFDMTYKRQLWTSGYEYRLRCPFCGTYVSYVDRQLGFRAWYPDGFVYCPKCRKPIRHSELFAVHPDGTPVYKTQ